MYLLSRVHWITLISPTIFVIHKLTFTVMWQSPAIWRHIIIHLVEPSKWQYGGDLHMAMINIYESTEPSIQNTVYPLNRRPLGERQHIGILRTAITILISYSNWFVFIREAWSNGDYRPKTCWPVAPEQVFAWRGQKMCRLWCHYMEETELMNNN